jgi:hypothetical protein
VKRSIPFDELRDPPRLAVELSLRDDVVLDGLDYAAVVAAVEPSFNDGHPSRGDPLAKAVSGALSAGGLLLTVTALVAAIRTGNLGLICAAAIGVIFTALALSAFFCLRGSAAAPTNVPQVIRGNVASPFSCSSRSRVL